MINNKMSFILNILSKLYLLDLIAPKVEFTTNGRSKQASIGGVIFSILIIVVTFLSSKNTTQNFFYQQSPKISSERSVIYKDNPGISNIAESIYIRFTYLDINSLDINVKNINNDLIFMPYVQLMKQNNENFDYIKQFNMKKCSNEFINDYVTSDLSYSTDMDNLSIEELKKILICLPSQESNFTVSYYNSTKIEFSIDEKLRAEVNKFSLVIMSIYYKDLIISGKNYTNPYNYVWRQNQVVLDTTSYYSYVMAFKTIELSIFDPSFLFENKRETLQVAVQDHFSLDIFKNNFDFKSLSQISEKIPFITISLAQSFNQEIIEIRYTTFDEVLANIGGYS